MRPFLHRSGPKTGLEKMKGRKVRDMCRRGLFGPLPAWGAQPLVVLPMTCQVQVAKRAFPKMCAGNMGVSFFEGTTFLRVLKGGTHNVGGSGLF